MFVTLTWSCHVMGLYACQHLGVATGPNYRRVPCVVGTQRIREWLTFDQMLYCIKFVCKISKNGEVLATA